MELLSVFLTYSENILSIKIFNNVQVYHIFYFLIFVGGIHKIYKIIRGDY